MNKDTIDFAVRSIVAWLVRPRTIERRIFRGAVLVLLALHGSNWVVSFVFNAFTVELALGSIIPDALLWGVTAICALLMLGAAWWAWRRYVREQELQSRKKVIAVEGRGLRDDDGSALVDAIPDSIVGTRSSYLMDLRQRKDGVIVQPEDLLEPVVTMKTWFHQFQKGHDRNDLTTVYGGLTAVPLTFLTGVLLDDESRIVVMDWDRSGSCWRLLDGPDDGLRFDVFGTDAARRAQEVVLAVSASYLVKSEDLATTFTYPVVRMTLPDHQSSHWSEAKQSALTDQFFGVVKELDALGVDHIHLVLAAQNSVVFNFGRRYDRRNLPKITVYQFERAKNPRYPWGIEMPVAGRTAPQVVRTASPAGRSVSA